MPSRSYVQRAAAWQRRRYRRAWGPSLVTEPSTVTFPTTPLRSMARIALGADLSQSYLTWNWLDITDRVRWDDGIEITAGRRDKADRVDSALAKLKAGNIDAALSRKNPLGPNYGLLGKAIPLWIALDPGTGFADRFFGFIVDPAKRWDRSATDSVVLVTARGLLHQLLRRQPLRSPMYNTISGAAESDFVPHAYWPCEEGSDATRIASGLIGGSAVTPTGGISYSVDGPVGSAPLPRLDAGAHVSFPISAYTDAGFWAVEITVNVPTEPASVSPIFEIAVSGTPISVWRVEVEPTGGFGVAEIWLRGYDSSGSLQREEYGGPLNALGGITEDEFFGNWFTFTVASEQNGSDLDMWLGFSDGRPDFNNVGSSSAAGTHQPLASTMDIRVPADFDGLGFGHAAVFTDPAFHPFFDGFEHFKALAGWVGEMAHSRIIRLCREQRISLLCNATRSTRLGVQPTGTFLEVLRDAEKADGGVLYEHQFGLAFQALSERYNQDVALTIDVALGQVAEDLEPDDNDLRYHNQWTATRPDGSEATVQGRDGVAGETLQATDPLYDAKDSFSVQSDDQLIHVAGWLVRRDSLEEDHWPNVAINLAAHPELIASWLAMGYGQRLNVLNVMEQAGIDTIDALREGYTERWNSREWEARMNTAPAVTYHVGTAGDSNMVGSWLQTGDGTKIVAELGVGETDPLVWSDGPVFSTDSADLDYSPLQVVVGGEVMPVTAIASVGEDDFTRSVTDDWGTATSGQTWSVSGAAANYDVSGTRGQMAVAAANSSRMAIFDIGATDGQAVVHIPVPVLASGASYFTYLFLRAEDFTTGYYGRIEWATSGTATLRLAKFVSSSSTFLSSGFSLGAYSAADVWGLRFDLEGEQLQARAWNTTGDEPDFWQQTGTDPDLTAGTNVGLRLFVNSGNTNVPFTQEWDDLNVVNPQLFTVERTLSKAHVAGDAFHSRLSVYRPLVAAL